MAKLFADAGVICITSLISPYQKDRDACRALLPKGDFIEVRLIFSLVIQIICVVWPMLCCTTIEQEKVLLESSLTQSLHCAGFHRRSTTGVWS